MAIEFLHVDQCLELSSLLRASLPAAWLLCVRFCPFITHGSYLRTLVMFLVSKILQPFISLTVTLASGREKEGEGEERRGEKGKFWDFDVK